ncbi:unnamed protein product [Clonostachys rosea f. rosea IK726]|uniref:3,4-dihydroxy-2-butanone-4-phosphate synthase n=2 Tax=Bionectria ochroleuca TaxID=29856 RepID=A0A0B7JSR8_BIOOC|nr:unnamed protein product [Clonostachys rosea f. rosea IK726]
MPSSTLDQSQFDSIPSCIESFKNGEFLVVLDDPSRENEADLIIAAESITKEQMAFMVRHSSGLICAPISAALTDKYALPQMVAKTEDPRGTAYTVSVDASHEKWGIKVCTIADLVDYVEKTEGPLQLNGSGE